MDIKGLLRLRYSQYSDRLAKPIAKELRASLDAQVVSEMSDIIRDEYDLSEESLELSSLLRKWHLNAKLFSYASALLALSSVGIFTTSSDYQVRMVSSHSALISSMFGIKSRRMKQEIYLIAKPLGCILAAKAATSLVSITEPRKSNKTSQALQGATHISEDANSHDMADTYVMPLQFDANLLLEEATGIGLLGNSGSGKSTLVKYLAHHLPNYQKLVLDPHDDPNESNWEGLKVISEYPAIAQQLQILLDLLTARDKTPLLIICEEWPAVRAYCKREGLGVADEFLLRYGSEARKFLKFPIFCSQSGNTKALGLEGMGDFLENFMLIRLGKIAKKFARNLPDQRILTHCKSVGYPCLIDDVPYIHPTHGHHTRAFKGALPQGLKPVTSPPLTIPLVSSSQEDSQ